jgi:hypothetical protein
MVQKDIEALLEDHQSRYGKSLMVSNSLLESLEIE